MIINSSAPGEAGMKHCAELWDKIPHAFRFKWWSPPHVIKVCLGKIVLKCHVLNWQPQFFFLDLIFIDLHLHSSATVSCPFSCTELWYLNTMPFPFLSLPAEIRCRIYTFYFRQHTGMSRYCDMAAPGGGLNGYYKYNLSQILSIFTVCRQIYEEASISFYDSCTFLAVDQFKLSNIHHGTNCCCLFASQMYHLLHRMGSENRLKIRHIWFEQEIGVPLYAPGSGYISEMLNLLSRGHRLRTIGLSYVYAYGYSPKYCIYKLSPQPSNFSGGDETEYPNMEENDDGTLNHSLWSIQQVKLEMDATIKSLQFKPPSRRFST